jgi:hypothetical protein
VELRRTRHDLHVLLRASVLERQVVLRQRANHVEEQAAWDDGLAGRRIGGLERNANAELHVGGLELRLSVVHAEEDAGERGNGTTRGRAAHSDAESSEERFTGNGELQKMLPISDRGDWRVLRS